MGRGKSKVGMDVIGPHGPVHLSPREVIFLQLVCGRELCFKEAAGEMKVQYHTLQQYSQRIYQKMGIAVIGGGPQSFYMVRLTKFCIRNNIISL